MWIEFGLDLFRLLRSELLPVWLSLGVLESADERANAIPKAAVDRVITTAESARSDSLDVQLGGQAVQQAQQASLGFATVVGIAAANAYVPVNSWIGPVFDFADPAGGEDQPVASNHNRAGRAQNRRVVVVVLE